MAKRVKKAKLTEAVHIEEVPAKTKEIVDMELLQETLNVNPFTQPLMKRAKLWGQVASQMNIGLEMKIYGERQCRERVKKLMGSYRHALLHKITGSGTEDPTATDILLKQLVEEEDRHNALKEADKEREQLKEAALKVIKKAALERLKKSREVEESDRDGTPDDTDPHVFEALSSREESEKSVEKLKVSLSPRKSYNRRKGSDPVMDYMERKADMAKMELNAKVEMQKADLEDRKEERQMKFAMLEIEKQKLENEERDRARRAENDQRMQECFLRMTEALCQTFGKKN